MFDPFNDFDRVGYLRNFENEKDLGIVKVVEHELFRANLPGAVAYLRKQENLTYTNFLKVHHILFRGFYPWAGQDRNITAPESYIHKGETVFSHPLDAKRAVDEGLRLGQVKDVMRTRLGEVMGLFAYGHPFLDGNGRTMLLVHAELCHRAGFSLAWQNTCKNDYLHYLTLEIASPGKGILDHYLLQFVDKIQMSREWIDTIAALTGLDGVSVPDEISGNFNDSAIVAEYEQFKRNRGYEIKD